MRPPLVYLNGRWLPEADARISVNDRGFLYGDGAFETVRRYDSGYFRFASHSRRFAEGAAILAIPCPEPDALAGVADEIARRNGTDDGVLRITLTRGESTGARLTDAGPPTLLATLRPLPTDWRARVARGWHVVTARTMHPPVHALPRQLKAQSRVYNILARLEAEAAGADDALLLSPDGMITEGPSWNIFWRRGDRLYTPAPEAGILEGVTRAVVFELAGELGLEVEQGVWPRSVLERADEIFATMSSLGPVPIHRLDDRALRPENGGIVRTLADRYWQRVAAEVRPAGAL